MHELDCLDFKVARQKDYAISCHHHPRKERYSIWQRHIYFGYRKMIELNNIVLKDNKPVWGNNCTHCMACIGNCPTQAIEYGTITQDKERYNFGKYRYVVDTLPNEDIH